MGIMYVFIRIADELMKLQKYGHENGEAVFNWKNGEICATGNTYLRNATRITG
jgi:hypothetical protein